MARFSDKFGCPVLFCDGYCNIMKVMKEIAKVKCSITSGHKRGKVLDRNEKVFCVMKTFFYQLFPLVMLA